MPCPGGDHTVGIQQIGERLTHVVGRGGAITMGRTGAVLVEHRAASGENSEIVQRRQRRSLHRRRCLTLANSTPCRAAPSTARSRQWC